MSMEGPRQVKYHESLNRHNQIMGALDATRNRNPGFAVPSGTVTPRKTGREIPDGRGGDGVKTGLNSKGHWRENACNDTCRAGFSTSGIMLLFGNMTNL